MNVILYYVPVIVDDGIYTSSTRCNLENKPLISELVIPFDIPLTKIRTIIIMETAINCNQLIVILLLS